MSVSLILQDENKKTLGGYLFIFFTLTTVIILHFYNVDLSDSSKQFQFLSTYLLISSFLSLSFITIRLDNYLNLLIFRDKEVPPFFKSNDTLPIKDSFYSPLMGKERDSFWGSILIAVGFFIGLSLPVEKIISYADNTYLCIFVFWGKNIICIATIGIIAFNMIFKQHKQVRKRLDISWRYISIISQIGKSEFYVQQINSLEDSIKLRLWDKAEYQIKTLNEIYLDNLHHLAMKLVDFQNAFKHLLGVEGFKTEYDRFNFSGFKDLFEKNIILGLKYHNSISIDLIEKRISDFNYINNRYEKYINQINEKGKILLELIQKDDVIKQRYGHFQSLLHGIEVKLFHIGNFEINIEHYGQIRNQVHNSENVNITKWFEGVTIDREFYEKFCSQEKEDFNNEVKIRILETKDVILDINNFSLILLPECETGRKLLNLREF